MEESLTTRASVRLKAIALGLVLRKAISGRTSPPEMIQSEIIFLWTLASRDYSPSVKSSRLGKELLAV